MCANLKTPSLKFVTGRGARTLEPGLRNMRPDAPVGLQCAAPARIFNAVDFQPALEKAVSTLI